MSSEIIAALQKAYSMELETVTNYLANSVHLDGLLAKQVKSSLETEIQDELTHATELANRIKQLGGAIPGSLDLSFDQKSLQPPEERTDVGSVIQGVIDAEDAAIRHYKSLIKMTSDEDPVTEDLAIRLLADEEGHLVLFRGFQRDLEKHHGKS